MNNLFLIHCQVFWVVFIYSLCQFQYPGQYFLASGFYVVKVHVWDIAGFHFIVGLLGPVEEVNRFFHAPPVQFPGRIPLSANNFIL